MTGAGKGRSNSREKRCSMPPHRIPTEERGGADLPWFETWMTHESEEQKRVT